jgi:hypothetical protein
LILNGNSVYMISKRKATRRQTWLPTRFTIHQLTIL